jgi:hypothetical protein
MKNNKAINDCRYSSSGRVPSSKYEYLSSTPILAKINKYIK